MNIFHATSVPTFTEDFKTILSEARSADIAVGCLLMPGFTQVARELSNIARSRILVGHTGRAVPDGIAAG